MKKDNKSGFSVTELILTTMIMAVVCVIAPVVVLKRSVKPTAAKKFNFISNCAGTNITKCVFNATTVTTKNDKDEAVTALDYNKNSNEFYVIELVGGGGGGTNKSVGYPGESKTIYLASLSANNVITNPNLKDVTGSDNTYKGILTGYYLMEIGKGGDAGKSGSPTRICVLDLDYISSAISSLSCDQPKNIIIAEAAGGITSNEELSETIEANIISNESNSYGSGGSKGGKGSDGIIVIK